MSFSFHEAEDADDPARKDLPAIDFVLLATLIRASTTYAGPEQEAFPKTSS